MHRATRTPGEREGGFTLIELLVVIIVIGVLAAIAIPKLVVHRQKAHDSATKADVTNLGKEVASYFIGGAGGLTLDYSTPGAVLLDDGSPAGFTRLTVGSAPPAVGAWRDLDDPLLFCVALTDPHGRVKDYRYTGLNGLEPGVC